MNEYMPEGNYGNATVQNTDIGGGDGSRIRYTNVILTILLAAAVTVGIVLIIMMARISKTSEKNSKMIQDMSKDLSSVENEVADISKTVDEILEQGCTGNNSVSEPDDPYDPFIYPEYGVEKPAIYIYGDGTELCKNVELELRNADMAVTWPEAENNANVYSWDVYADEDGTLTDKDGTEYSYLFWEADAYGTCSFDEGFCVAGNDTADFLKGVLSEIGLTDKEANEFIVYWLPRMQGNAYNLISFKGLDPDDEYNSDFALKVTDEEGNEAESVLRIMMVWKALDENMEITPQEFEGFERNGLTVVEWGGMEIK
ncbi:MAG: hypothetical protein J6X66_04675 [Lachnospiraceae bacterium]|nr:hypothetical protein [Lachnospiraceae bacterium]